MNVKYYVLCLVFFSVNLYAQCEKLSQAAIEKQLEQAAEEFDLDKNLLYAIVKIESNFDNCAVSPKGAAGVMQLMPRTARSLDVVDVFDSQQNIRGSARYLSEMRTRYKIPQLYLAAYNAGETAVNRKGYVPNYKETRQYIRKVIKVYKHKAQIIDDYQAVQNLTLIEEIKEEEGSTTHE